MWDPAPTTKTEALDQLAARAPLAGEGEATWATDTQTVWSYSLAEGERLGFRILVTTSHDNAGTLSQSIGSAEFVALRQVGGAAVVLTNGSPVETGDGTLAGGTLAVANSGNSVIATLTFTSLTGTAQFAWSLQRLVPPAA